MESFADMIGRRKDHSLFSMGNKYFVMGGHSNVDAEVFDGVSRKFTLLNLKLPCEQQSHTCNRETVSISRKVFAFCFCYKNTQPKLHVYDVDEKKWVSEETVKCVRCM